MQSGSSWSPVFAVYGDMGNENAEVLSYIQEDAERGKVTAVLHTGDFAYDMNDVSQNIQIFNVILF